MLLRKRFDQKIVEIIKNKGVGVLPTDTIYGLVGSALSKKVVKRIYQLRKRRLSKPMIILIGSEDDLKIFRIKINKKIKEILKNFWPGKVSIILPCPHKKFFYLHRGTKTLAFRLPKNKKLINFLKKTGPLVAPSANLEGKKPAETIKEAKKYFGEKIDFYLDGGRIKSLPSTLIAIKNDQIIIKR